MPAKKQFKAESKRLLDLMIHSIYTNKDIFLRELISNASDAIDKRYYRALSENTTGLNRTDFFIQLEIDKENRTLRVIDNGCGMTKEELENNLGVIAKSGSLAFKNENEPKDGIDIIGQFGVGFYAAFMVSDEVSVISRSFSDESAWCWKSSGSDGYQITPADKTEIGTEIILKIKQNTEDDSYDAFLDPYHLEMLVKKYSDYIRYPILLEKEKSRKKDDSDEYESYRETETLNSMVPLWRKNKNEVSKEEYLRFYSDKFLDFSEPLRIIHTAAEGASTYHALLFVPDKAPYNYYSRDFEKGLQLYSSGVLIMDKCPDLLPDYFSFVRGCVDSEDLSLNISREVLQNNRQLGLIAGRIEKKIKSELALMLKNERETYEKFWTAFGRQIKYGLYSSFGAAKDVLEDLLLFYSSCEGKLCSLEEYHDRMPESQKYIYYATGDSVERLKNAPQTELLREQGYEILYLLEDVDEFTVKMLRSYKEKEFRSVSDSDLGIDPPKKPENDKTESESKELLEAIKTALAPDIFDVKISSRLKTAPVCLSTEGEISLEMERVLNALPDGESVKAQRVLELNPDHPLFAKISQVFKDSPEHIEAYAQLLYGQALLLEGILPEDPASFTGAVTKLVLNES